ncbi:MAG: transporter [Parasphingorhabdus sp.]|uniref:transporter n=1 Tax=Parasphingorhabdus sp. TaxID=2709688 RepID=UPI0030023A92
MTTNHLSSLTFIAALPAVAFCGGTASAATTNEASTVDHISPAPQLTAAEAEAESARIMERLSAAQSPAQSAEAPSEVLPVSKPDKLPIELTFAGEDRSPVTFSEQETGNITAALQAIQSELAEQKTLIASQNALIQSQSNKIQQLELHNQLVRAATPVATPFALSQMRGAGINRDQVETAAVQIGTSPDDSLTLPEGPVGEAPPETQNIERKVEAVPEGQGVLTPRGQFVLDPSIEYTRSSTNRLVFRGIELIPGIQIGAIEASDADRDTVVATFAMRYGLTNRLEIEGRVPLLYRKDRIQVVQQRDEQITREVGLEETGIGDAELSLRYQLNRPKGQGPIWVAGLRVKGDTGKSPYEIPFDEFGVATGLATGSGFWGVQPSISFLMPSDPVVIYGGLGYLWNIERNIDKIVGDVLVGKVDPGDAVNASVGFGFALNPRFSFSLGYRHNYIFSTRTQLGDTFQDSNDIQVGSFNFGMSYRLSERQSLNLGFQFGVTEDAPDVSIVARIPFRF